MTSREEQSHRIVISRLVFGCMLVFLLFRFLLRITPSHLLQPPLFLLDLDITYWFYKFSGIPDLIIYSQAGAVTFDIFLFATCILSVLFPLRRIFIVTFSLLFFLYAVTYNTFIVHHAHPLTIMTLITVPFWFKNQSWNIMWKGMRYYVCYIYVMSFIWKLWINDSFFYWDQGIGSVKLNLVEYLYHYPDTFRSSFFRFFISHPQLLNIGNTFIFLLEGLMCIGFFTKRYDRLLMIIPVIIHLCTYLFADVFFMEMLVLIFVFFTKPDTKKIGERFPFMLKYTGYGKTFNPKSFQAEK